MGRKGDPGRWRQLPLGGKECKSIIHMLSLLLVRQHFSYALMAKVTVSYSGFGAIGAATPAAETCGRRGSGGGPKVTERAGSAAEAIGREAGACPGLPAASEVVGGAAEAAGGAAEAGGASSVAPGAGGWAVAGAGPSAAIGTASESLESAIVSTKATRNQCKSEC